MTMPTGPPLTGSSSSKKFLTEKATWLILLVLSYLAPAGGGHLPWDNWSWDLPQQPIQHYFRRHDKMPVKTPTYQCVCPPSDECKIEYKINEEAIDFLKLRGVLKDEDVKQYKNDIRIMNETAKIERRMRARRSRRDLTDAEEGEPCCCPPKTLMMPTFITQRRSNKLRNYFHRQDYETPNA